MPIRLLCEAALAVVTTWEISAIQMAYLITNVFTIRLAAVCCSCSTWVFSFTLRQLR